MHARVQSRHREYEIVYLLAPSTTPGGATRVGDSIREVIDENKGRLLKVDLWGIRPLAYRIKGNKQGIYYYMRFIATQGTVDEMERRLKLADPVLRYLTVRLSVHEVDPAAYTVKEEEAEFKGIDELHESLQAEAVVAAEPAEMPAVETAAEPVQAPAVETAAKPVQAPAVETTAEPEKKPAAEASAEPVEVVAETPGAGAEEQKEASSPPAQEPAVEAGTDSSEKPEVKVEVDGAAGKEGES